METATQERVSADPFYEELNRLFQLYLLANLNVRYYGVRAESFEWWIKVALITTSVLSTLALSLILGVDQSWARTVSAVSAGLAAVISGVTPFCGWSEKVRDLRSLRFAYSQLFGQIESAITEIKRAGSISPEHIGLARMVHDAYTRIEALDEFEPNQKLIDREDAKVRKAFPDDYLWTHF